jgi:type II secretory pathway pseudopilin PulG
VAQSKSNSLSCAITKSRSGTETSRGFILIALMLGLALIAITLMTVLPAIKVQIRRDNEEEMTHRALQYSRAVKRFYRKFGRYPARIEELENTNEVRSLRKRYKDPVTGEDFKILHLADVLTNPTGQQGGLFGANAAGGNKSQGGVNANSAQADKTNAQPDQASAGSDAAGSNTQAGKGNSANPDQDSPGPLGGNGPEFGGGPIVGVASASKDQAVREYNKKSHYNEWLFIYLPNLDRGGLLNGPVFPDQVSFGFAPPQTGPTPTGNLSGAPGMAAPPPVQGPGQAPPQQPQGPPNPNPDPQPPDQ